MIWPSRPACSARPGAIAHDCLAGTIVLGEVNLDGTVLPINGLLPIMLHAREQGIATIIVPYANLERPVSSGCQGDRREACRRVHRTDGRRCGLRIPEATHAVNADVGATAWCPPPGDMSEVMGQHAAKWALEVAAAGGHHLMMTGPPGTGKTMLASRIPGIMSPLNETEQLEVASIRSLCGTLPGYGISDVPPFEAPHHTASTAALVGGGAGIGPARSHHPRASRHPVHGRGSGILGAYAADAARTFGIRICRDFQSERHHILSGSLPTDYGGESLPVRLRVRQRRALHLPEKDRVKYFSRLSGPILDRIDIQIEVPPVERISPGNAPSGDSSHAIRLRVIVARQMAQERFREFGWCCNAQATGTWLRANTSPRPSIGQPRLGERAAEPAWRRPCHAACVDIIRSGGKDFPRT